MIPTLETDLNIIQQLDDYPNDVGGLSAAELKAKFDESGLTIQEFINERLIPAMTAENIPFTSVTEIPANNVDAALKNIQGQIAAAITGSIPNGSLARVKFTSEVNAFLDLLRADATATDGKAEANTAAINALSAQHTQDINALGASVSALQAADTAIGERITEQVSRLDGVDAQIISDASALSATVSAQKDICGWNAASSALNIGKLGGEVAPFERVFCDPFNDQSNLTLATAYFENSSLKLSSTYAGSPMNYSGEATIPKSGSPTTLGTIVPSESGTLSDITLHIKATLDYGSVASATFTVYLYDGGTSLGSETVTASFGGQQSLQHDVTISGFNISVTAGHTYTVKAIYDSPSSATFKSDSGSYNLSTTVYTSGSGTTGNIQIPTGSTKALILTEHANGNYTLGVAFGSGAFEAVTADKTISGFSYGFKQYSVSIPAGASAMKLKFNLSSGAVVNGYAVAFV